uniref:F-box domain-containing protein n=2 Tax=Caenorhabditis japonica TaxID=281687 RepID=A0A8R1DQB1_CAEJA
MLTWSTASTLKPNLQRCHSKAAENFLQSWDSAVYEGEAMKDIVLNKEASLWSEKFPHLRVVGVNCDGQGARMQLLEMYNYIGGFEKWSELNDDCKRHVIGYLNYWTRCNLSLCSKKDNELVKNAVLFASKENGIRWKQDLGFEKQSIETLELRYDRIELCTTSGFSRSWQFFAKREKCRIVSKSCLENVYSCSNVRTIPRENVEKEFWNIVKSVLSKGKDELRELVVHAKWNPKNDIPGNLSAIKELNLEYKSEEECRFWLNRLDPKCALNTFTMVCDNSHYHPVTFEHILHPAVLNAKCVQIDAWVHISDEQFLQLNATKIRMSCLSISSDAFLEFLKRWVYGEMDSDFSHLVVYTNEKNNKREIQNKISQRFRSRRYDYLNYLHPEVQFIHCFHRFRPEGIYCEVEKRDDPLCIVSVLITNRHLVIMRTGFARSGRLGIEYKYPML